MKTEFKNGNGDILEDQVIRDAFITSLVETNTRKYKKMTKAKLVAEMVSITRASYHDVTTSELKKLLVDAYNNP